MLDHLGNLERTHSCGELRATDIGKQVTLMGWVAKRRDFGELTFIDLRDRAGLTQVVLNPAFSALTADDFEVIQLGWKPTQLSAPTNLRIIR